MSIYGALFGIAFEKSMRLASRIIAAIVILLFLVLGLTGAVIYLLVTR